MTNPIDRRIFLGGALGLPAALAGQGGKTAKKPPAPSRLPRLDPASRRTLGRTGLKVGLLGLGAIPGKPTLLYNAALDAGVNLLDTAKAYGDDELRKAPVVKARRKEIVLCSKTYIPVGGKKPAEIKKRAKADCERSLKRLGTDWLDIYHIHAAGHLVWRPEYEPLLEAFEELRKEGKIRFIGVSTHRAAGDPEGVVKTLDTGKIDVLLVGYNFLHPGKPFERIFEAVRRNHVGVIAMKTGAGNFKQAYLPDKTVEWREEFRILKDHWRLLPRLKPFLKEGRSVPATGLAWALARPEVACAISALRNFSQLRENLEAAAGEGRPLKKKEEALLDEYRKGAGHLACRLCGSCRDACPVGVDLPEAARTTLYALGYQDLGKARALQASLPPFSRADQCARCGSCEDACPHGVDLPRLVTLAWLFTKPKKQAPPEPGEKGSTDPGT
ncbi:MAG TPA: hypothetical protein ENJ97_03970 [Planctomycetes bacterium]|nr:hypothetical protein [Planctomycetota bacterium]